MTPKKYYYIYCHQLNKYWNRIDKNFVDIDNCTRYEGKTPESLEHIIMNDNDLLNKSGLTYSVISVIHIENEK